MNSPPETGAGTPRRTQRSGRTWPGLALLTAFSCAAYAADLKPFVSDGCSAFPEGTFSQQQLWLDCCTQHDYAYWKGGTYGERLAADEELQLCVAAVGEPEIANLMLAGVRVGGSPFFPTPFRWGYGWPFGRGYQPLTDEDRRVIDEVEARARAD